MRKLLRRIAHALQTRRHERELADEIAFHREMTQQEIEARGVPSRDAAIEARRVLGNDALAVNRARDVWIWPWLQDLSQDVRFAGRLLLKDRRFTAASVVALALGIGATTTAFTFVNGAVLRPLPLEDGDRLVFLRMVDARQRPLGVSYADARDWRAASKTLSHVATSFDFAMNVSEEGLPAQRLLGSNISIEAFSMIGATPMVGRGFLPEDDHLDAPRVAILAHSIWTTRYGGDAAIVGRVIKVNDVPTTIIGVMPARFHFPFTTEIWMPAAFNVGPPATIDARRGSRNVLTLAVGRLADGIERSQAQAELDTITSRLAGDFPDTNAGVSVAVESLDAIYRDGMKQMLLLVMAAVVVVLLIACVNVANLLLARAANRTREIAIRASLGGSRWRIVRQLLIESLMLATVAGGLSLLLSLYGVRVYSEIFTRTSSGPPPFWWDFSMDARVYTFLAVTCLAASLAFGLTPALHISKTDARDVLKDASRSHSAGVRARRWTGALMIGQLAMTLVLLAGAGLMLRSFVEIYRAARVLDTSNMVTMRLSLAGQKYAQPESIKAFFRQLDERLSAMPAMGSVTVASDIPIMTLTNSLRQLEIAGRDLPAPPPMTAYLYIGPRYFETMRLRLIRGRALTESDGSPGQEAVIVNQRFASMFFPDADPIGQRIRLTNAAAPTAPKPWFTIIGIAPTIPQILDARDPEPVVYSYVTGEPAPHRLVSIIARTDTAMADVVASMRHTVHQLDPALPGYFVQTMDEVAANTRWGFRIFGTMFASLAGIALLLASVGLYALTAHGVRQRTHEIGVRVALGARTREVLWLFVRRTLVQLVIGLGLGLAGAIVAGRFLERFLVRTAPTDPLALTIVTALLIVVATLASVLPARRATQVDPMVALRCE
jgi:putative ABC transport system permease protein